MIIVLNKFNDTLVKTCRHLFLCLTMDRFVSAVYDSAAVFNFVFLLALGAAVLLAAL